MTTIINTPASISFGIFKRAMARAEKNTGLLAAANTALAQGDLALCRQLLEERASARFMTELRALHDARVAARAVQSDTARAATVEVAKAEQPSIARAAARCLVNGRLDDARRILRQADQYRLTLRVCMSALRDADVLDYYNITADDVHRDYGFARQQLELLALCGEW